MEDLKGVAKKQAKGIVRGVWGYIFGLDEDKLSIVVDKYKDEAKGAKHPEKEIDDLLLEAEKVLPPKCPSRGATV